MVTLCILAAALQEQSIFNFQRTDFIKFICQWIVYADSADGAKYVRPYLNSTELKQDFIRPHPNRKLLSTASGEVIVKISDYVNDTFSLYFYSISALDYVIGQPATDNWYESHITFQRLGDIPS